MKAVCVCVWGGGGGGGGVGVFQGIFPSVQWSDDPELSGENVQDLA